uniref:Uncharacterized protein n=1 Tax=Bartonella rochalimae ATCC BAA-1498 TaxID=685782 RepID=E6YJR8_9HYPH|nr:hypothetical protein BARRO_10039 [Bartonella rochalimae ATCC BAA-1498]
MGGDFKNEYIHQYIKFFYWNFIYSVGPFFFIFCKGWDGRQASFFF